MSADFSKCPICAVALIKNEANGDLHCPDCKRDWYVRDIAGAKVLASRRRYVRLNLDELREGGDMRKAILPA